MFSPCASGYRWGRSSIPSVTKEMRTPSTLALLSLMGTVLSLPISIVAIWCWESVRWAQKCVSSCSWRPHPSCEPLDATLKPWIHNNYSSPHCEDFHANKKNNERECGPLGMRDVKDRDAELRMEWDSDYTIAVAEYSSWAEEASWGVQGPEVKINVETTVFLEQTTERDERWSSSWGSVPKRYPWRDGKLHFWLCSNVAIALLRRQQGGSWTSSTTTVKKLFVF